MSDAHSASKALAAMISASLFFALMNLCSKSVAAEMPAAEVAFFRTLVTLLLLTPSMCWTGHSLLGKRKDLLFVRGLFGFLSLVLGFYAFGRIRLADALTLWKTSVIFTALLSALVFKERLSMSFWFYLFLAFAGVILIIKPHFDVVNIAGLAAICAGFFVGIVAVSIRRLHQTESSLTIVYSFALYGTVFGLLFFGGSFIAPTLRQAAVLGAMGLFGTAGQLLYTVAFRYAAPSFSQPYSFAEILFSLCFAALICGEFPDASAALGIAMLAAAGVAVARKRVIQPALEAE